MSVVVTYRSQLDVVETFNDTFLDASDKTLKFTGLSTPQTTYTGSSNPGAVTKQVNFEKTLSSGAGTIDLRNLVGAAGAVVDANGLKVKFAKLRGKNGNANPITITKGASNGLDAFGTAFSFDLKADQEALFYLADGSITIDSTHKTLDLAGTGSQVLQVELIMG